VHYDELMRKGADSWSRHAGLVVGLVVAGALVGAGCGDEQLPTDYGLENRAGFLTACARPLDDPRLLNDICACAYDQIEAEYRFDEFVEIDAELAAAQLAGISSPDADDEPDAEVVLPEEITKILAECIIEEAEL